MTSEATHSQHGIWFTERAGVAGAAYHMAVAIRFDGDLDARALIRACEAVLRRHQALRCAVAEQDGALRLVPAAQPPGVLCAAYQDDLVSTEVARPFDLATGPLARFTLAHAGPDHHLLLFTAHHLVFDGMSKDLLVRELAAGYAAGGDPALPPLPLSYPEYTATERERVAGQAAAARAFWRDRFAEPGEVVLPGLRRTPAGAEPGALHEFTLDERLTGGIERTARDLGVTRFELVLAAVHGLLGRYGNRAVPLAVDMSTRTEPVADQIGLFVNELPVTVPPAGSASFREYAAAVRAELREVYRFRDVPISHAVGALRPRAAICPVSVSYRRRAAQEVTFPGLDTTVDWMVFHHTARNALHLQLVDSAARVDVGLHYAPAAIGAAAVARIGAHLRTLLESVVADPDRAVADLPVLPPAERERLLAAGTGPARTYPPELTVAAGVAAQARATPEAVAVVCGQRRLSYQELDAEVARLAGALRHRGVGAGDLVALCLPRSVETVAVPLAVGRVGAAYLPLDPGHPPHRRRLILAEAAPALLVTTGPIAAELDGAVPALCVDRPVPGEPVTTVAGAAAGGTAYVIFTSGSTGRPKGVAVPHRAMLNLLLGMRDALDTGPEDVWLCPAALSFDMSVPELFLPLLVGARTVVVPEDLVRDGAGQVHLIRREGVTHLQATPSGWRMLLDSGFGTGEERSVIAVAGAEALPLPLARELRGRVARLFNVYGPTEATVWATCAELPEPVTEVTIGRPLPNTFTYLLDDRRAPVPEEVPGELFIGGVQVADGYLGRPELTAQRFLPDPFYGGRMYRTGDLCRVGPDGQLVFLGRVDDQVKLRGHRIELGEVEAALLGCEGVRQAAVALRGGEDPRLVGYLVGEPPPPQEVRERLAARLPAVMVPTAWVTLDRLPLTPNGKLDRAALPDPPTPRSVPVTISSTQDETTEQVLAIWRDVLKIDQIDPEDDLFDLGGHSLTITRIIARIHQAWGVTVPLETFYDTPTLAEIAEAVRELRGSAQPA